MKSKSPVWPVVQRDHKPWTRWWWHGSAVDERNLKRELRALRDAGFGGVEITPIYGVAGAETRDVAFLSDRWLELMLYACCEAKRLGLGVDVIPGTGWRLGGADVPMRERSVKLTLDRKEAPDGARYLAKAAWSREPIKRPAPGGEGYSIDMFDRLAVAHHLERFNRRFFDRVPADLVRAQFHDSWEYATDWSHRLLDEFAKRRGYDLRDFLEAFDPVNGTLPKDTVGRVLHDFRLTIEEMLLDNFSGTWSSLCHKRGLRFRNQAHGSPGNLLDIYAQADIPETEIFCDGIDPLVQKFASSAGHVAGRKLISAESYTWLSDHWRSDLGKVKRYTDYLFLCGINHIVCHGTAYSPADAAWPGWLFYASTQINSRNPLWRDWPVVNAYIARCQSFLQAGEPDESVLVYWPLSDLSMKPEGRLRHFCISGASWGYGEPLHETAQVLWDRGVPFDYVSDRQLQQAAAEGNRVRLPGGTYRAVVLPPLRYIPAETVLSLRKLAEAGVPIVGGGDPGDWDVPGLQRLAPRRRFLRRDVAALRRQPAFTASATPGTALDAEACGGESFQAGTGLRCVRRRLEDGSTLYFVVNRGDVAFDGWVNPAAPGTQAILRDPWTADAGCAPITRRGLRLQLEPQQSILVELPIGKPAFPRWRYDRLQISRRQPVAGPWTISFVAGGPRRPKPIQRKTLASITEFGIPELRRFGGTVRYETRFGLPSSDAATCWWLDLGEVRHSARVFLNGIEVGVLVQAPFRIALPTRALKRKVNQLAVEVTTLAANRIRDLDRRGVSWKIFRDINFVNDRYKPFDASGWDLMDGGLLGPVTLVPSR